METQKFDKEYLAKINVNPEEDYGPGPWQIEPDKANWIDETTQLPCMIVRNHSGNLCGYVGVPLDSKLAGKDYDEIDVHIHGGLTYAAQCNGVICHLASEEVYWFGFDTAHSGDYSPYYFKYAKNRYDELFNQTNWEIYRDFDYVKNEVTSLAQQIKELL